jgi:serine protease Do
MRGEVVGINTAIFSRAGGSLGIGFAIPIDLAKEILPELIKSGKVTRGWLGVTIQRVTPEIAESLGLEKSRGALVANVAEGSPAEQGGIKVGDVIVEYNGKPIEDSNQLPILVARSEIGKNVQAAVVRDKKRVPITVKVGELKEQEVVASAPKEGKLGLTVQNVTPQVAESLGLKHSDGVVITSVQPQSPAAEAGLRRGDVVVEVNRKKTANADEFQKIVSQAKPNENLLFLIERGGSTLFLALRSPGNQG